ncbi:MAG: carbohydrate-binding protein [Bacillota bacterium]
MKQAGAHRVENLEQRLLLAWGDFPQLIDQDLAATSFPQINGAGQAVVALDTGVNFWHPALAGRIWTNPGEIPGNGIDDDRSGKIDDVNGWDFINNDNNPADDQGHGTMVAGIMVANHFINTGNRHGYAGDGREYQGIAPGAEIIPLRVVNSTNYLDVRRVEAALQWVIANYQRYDITAINMSIGMSPSDYAIIDDEMKTLWESGVFIAAASGNTGNTDGYMSYPAASPYAMSVGALNVNNTVNSITSRGVGLDILAPGNAVPYLNMGTDYELGGAGTSYATPFITAAATLIKQVNPNFSCDQIKQILKDSGANVYDSATGLTFKRLDVDNAIRLAFSRSGQTPPTAPTSTTGQTPFATTPIPIPGYIQAENFDNGGEGVAYHDLTSGNDGTAYRNTGVDLQPTNDAGGGYHVSHTKAGEWIEYTIQVGATATYDIAARVASYSTGGNFHIEVDGANKTGTMIVPSTGSWQNWTTVRKTGVNLSAGTHVLRLSMDTAPNGYVGNFNWLQITRSAVTAQRLAQDLTQAENYDGSSGVVKGSTNLSYVDAGDWVLYRGVDFSGGVDSFTARIALADAFAGRQIQLRVDSLDGPIIGSLTTRGTGGWGIYQEQTAAIAGIAGVHDLYLTFVGGDGVGNIDWFRFA